MIPDPSLYSGTLRTALTQSVPLSAPQKAALATELTKPAYRLDGASGDAQGQPRPVADLVTLLNDPVSGPNPTPQGRVALPVLSQGQVIVIMTTLQAKKAGALMSGATLPEGLDYIVDTLMPSVAKQESLDVAAPTAQAMMGVIHQSGLLSDAEIAALTTAPDPAWQPLVTAPSPAQALGLGVVEVSDINAALADISAALGP